LNFTVKQTTPKSNGFALGGLMGKNTYSQGGPVSINKRYHDDPLS